MDTPQNSAPDSRHHLEGQTVFVDDQLPRQGTLEARIVTAPYARATITGFDKDAALAVAGVRGVILAEDIPGTNSVAPTHADEALIAGEEVEFFGQIVAVVIGDSEAACDAGAEALEVSYQPLPPIIGIEEAIAVQSFHSPQRTLSRGDFDAAIAVDGLNQVQSSFYCGGQEHFYLETQVALAEPDGRGGIRVACSSEDLSGLQAQVAQVLASPMNRVEVECPRIGGGFAGKQTQSRSCALVAGLAAGLMQRPVRVSSTREQDMLLTGKRHPVYGEFHAGFDANGKLQAVEVFVYLDGGCSLENSDTVLENLLLHLDNAYHIPNFRMTGRVCKTNTVSNTLCVGAGAPQAVALIEEMIGMVARSLGLVPEIVRQRNMYRLEEGGDADQARAHYGQDLPVKRLEAVWRSAIRTSEFAARRKSIALWNSKNPYLRRGLAVVPVKFGVGTLDSSRGQASCVLQAYVDGSLRVSFGGVDTGQGIASTVVDAVADELGVAQELIRASGGDTALTPNSPTGSGIEADLASEAARDACRGLKSRLRVQAAQLLQLRGAQVSVMEDVRFANGEAFSSENPEIRVSFAELVYAAHASRVDLLATGFARSHSVKYDYASGKGEPFREFTFGAAVSEVQVDCLTGEARILRSDLLVDTGPVRDTVETTSAIRGAFVQGVGWLTSEELLWGGDGELLTVTPDTYKVPTIGDTPLDFRVTVIREKEGTVPSGSATRSKDPTACSFMLALSVRGAIKDAVLAGRETGVLAMHLPIPATPESIYHLIEQVEQQ